jgi:hypothetical protein
MPIEYKRIIKMLREIIKPQSSQYTVNIPNEYINKNIEILILPLEEDNITKEIRQRANQYEDGTLQTVEFSSGLDKIRNKLISQL